MTCSRCSRVCSDGGSGVNLTLEAGTLVALLMGTARAAGFLIISPPFASRSIPGPVRAAFSLLLAVTVLPTLKGGGSRRSPSASW